MLVLYETAAGFSLFKVSSSLSDEISSEKGKGLCGIDVNDVASVQERIKLVSAFRFDSVAEAVNSAAALSEGKMSRELKRFLKSELEGRKDRLAVVDAKLGGRISRKLGIQVVSDSNVQEIIRHIRAHAESLLQGMIGGGSGETGKMGQVLNTMQLGLAHSLSRLRLRFSPERVADTMIVQAIGLLDELDKELNTYAMRLREWYGWHFPELTHILPAGDNITYARVVLAIGQRSSLINGNNSKSEALSHLLPEELEESVIQGSQTSMGTDISEQDLSSIKALADQVIALGAYRSELSTYLRNRMLAIAPNLTAMVGELVGARLIAHAGSLLSLAKQPASTLQILGAEKALFRALKTRANTPKYGLLFHASLVGQAAPKLKGKISRVLAAKTALAVRVDAFSSAPTEDDSAAGATKTSKKSKNSEDDDEDEDKISTSAVAPSFTIKNIALENRLKVEQRLRQLEGKARAKLFGRASAQSSSSFPSSAAIASASKSHHQKGSYNPTSDIVLDTFSKPIVEVEAALKNDEKKIKEKKPEEKMEEKKEKSKESKKEGKSSKEGKSKESKKEKSAEKKLKEKESSPAKEEKKEKKRKSVDGDEGKKSKKSKN